MSRASSTDDAAAEVAAVVEGGGEDRHAREALGLQLGPDDLGVGVGGGGVADDQLDGDVPRGDRGEELSVQPEHRVRVGLVAHPAQSFPFEHRHRFVVAGDGGVEDGLGQPGLAGERLVDGLHGDAGRCSHGGHGGGSEAVGEEQVVGGVDDGAPGAAGLFLARRRAVGPAGLDFATHSVDAPLSDRGNAIRTATEERSCRTHWSSRCLATTRSTGG